MTKTATLEFRQGNETRYQDKPAGVYQPMGLPNNGLDYYLTTIAGTPGKVN